MKLIATTIPLVALVFLAATDSDLLRTLADLTPGIGASWVRSVVAGVNIAASVAVFGVLVAIVVDALRRHRFTLTRAVSAATLGVLIGHGLTVLLYAVGAGASLAVLAAPPPNSPGLTLTAAVAALVGADLPRRPIKPVARVAFVIAVGCALVLGSLTFPSVAYAVLVGIAVGLGVRAAMGVIPARPSSELMQAVLTRAGWPVTDLHPVAEAAGRSRYRGQSVDGGELQITVVDRDRRGVPLARRAARLLFLRASAVGRPALSLRWQLERQTLCSGLARSAGVAAPSALALLAAGPALILVEHPLEGQAFAGKESPTPDDCAAVAEALRRFHDAGLSLGAIAADSILLLADGRAGFADLVAAQPASTELQRELDVVTMLATLASKVGAARAVAALRTGYGTTETTEARLIALEQPVALPRPIRRLVRGTPLLNELRIELAGRHPEAPVPSPARLERLRPRTVISVVGGAVAAYLLASQLSQVNIFAALKQAEPVWLVVALLGSALTYLGSALAKQAFAPASLSFARTVLVQLASSFLALVTPPTVGHVGVNLRYLQRAGVATAVAATSIAASEILVVGVTVIILLLSLWLSGASSSELALLPSGTVTLILVGAAAILALAAAIPFTRRLLRRRVQPLVRRALPQLLATAGDPRRLGGAVTGVLMLNGGYILALEAPYWPSPARSHSRFSSSCTSPVRRSARRRPLPVGSVPSRQLSSPG